MRVLSVKLILVVGVVVLVSTDLMAADGRIDLRLGQKKINDRIDTPRLALGTLKDKDKKAELQVEKKRRSAKKKPTRRVSRDDNQRKRKTKRVVAAQ